MLGYRDYCPGRVCCCFALVVNKKSMTGDFAQIHDNASRCKVIVEEIKVNRDEHSD